MASRRRLRPYSDDARKPPTGNPDSATAIAIRLAVALAERHRSPLNETGPVSLRDAAAFCSGELSSWASWELDAINATEERQVAMLLRHRPRVLANSEDFVRTAIGLDLAEYAIDAHSATALPRHGRRVDDLIDELERLLTKSSSGSVERAPQRTVEAGLAQFWIDSRRYSVNVPASTGATADVTRCRLAPAEGAISVSFAELRETASALVAAGRDSYLARVDDLVDELVDSDGRALDALTVAAGPTVVASAPTGSGKSVLLRVLASHLARTGRTVTLVVPDTAAVVTLAMDIEADLAALQLPATVAGLVSPDGAMAHFRKRATDADCEAAEVRWVGERWAYACALGGAIDGPDTWPVGREPCRRCPFQHGCAKFAEQERAVTADVIVVNHHNFVAGRLRIPVEIDGAIVERMAVSELALRRSDLVCVDEVDEFQAVVADQASSTLHLTNGQEVHHSLRRLHDEAETVIAQALSPAARRRFHAAWTHLTFLITSYVAGCVGELGPFDPRGRAVRRLVLPGRHDPVMALRLARRAESDEVSDRDFALLYALDGSSSADLPDDLQTAAAQLSSLVTNDDGVDRLASVQATLIDVLADRLPDRAQRSNTVDLLIHRAYLRAIGSAVRLLSTLLAELRDAGIASVGEIEEGLGRLSAWQLAPWGLLGQLRMAFSVPLPAEDGTDDDLSLRAIAGDPHEYVAELGRALALTLAQTRRPVLALSATAYMPGAATTHVHRPVSLAVPDDPAAPVAITLRHVIDDDGAPVRLSGLRQSVRDGALATMGAGLWRQHLDPHLHQLATSGDRAGRVRALVVANSYRQLCDIAAGMISAGCSPQRIVIAVPDDEAGRQRLSLPQRVASIHMSRFARVTGDHPACDVLFAPLARVSRGLNLVTADGRSAIASIWLAIRPVPLVDEPDVLLAHAGARARHSVPAGADFGATLSRRRAVADAHLRSILNSPPHFSRLAADVRLDLTATVVVELIQLLGRARRGGTEAELNLVDAAFLGTISGHSGWPALVRALRDRWAADGDLPILQRLYGGTLGAILAIADYASDVEADAC